MNNLKDLKEPTTYRSDDFKSSADFKSAPIGSGDNDLEQKFEAFKTAFNGLSTALNSCLLKPKRVENLIDPQKAVETPTETTPPSPFKPFEMKIE